MANFSSDELELINQQKKLTKNLPQYYLASTNSSQPISRNFENYLILQTVESKQKTLAWTKQAIDLAATNTDRDAILDRYFGLRTTDASARVSELDTALKGFEGFRAQLLSNEENVSRFAGLEETNALSLSMQKPIDELTYMRDQAYHEQTLTSILKLRFDARKDTANTQKELETWQNVITSYPGQSTSTGVPPGLSGTVGGLTI